MPMRLLWSLIFIFCSWTCRENDRAEPGFSRLANQPNGVHFLKQAEPQLHLGSMSFWTKDEIAGWQRDVADGFVTLRSPELEIGNLEDLAAIDIEVADFRGRNRFTLHWNDSPDLNSTRALLRRRELTTFAGFDNAFHIDGQNLVDIEKQGRSAEKSPFRYLFLRFSSRKEGDVAFDSISIIGKSSALATSSHEPARIGVKGQFRLAYAFRAPMRINLEANLAKGGDFCFGLHSQGGKKPLKLSLTVTGTETVLFRGLFVDNGSWQDFRTRVRPQSGTSLTLAIESDGQIAPIYLSNPLFLNPNQHKYPNIIIYLCDALRAEQMSLYGYEKKTTPFLDELAKTGLVFDKAFAPVSWTKPSIVTMMTSLYPQTHGVGERSLGDILPEAVPTMADILGGRGYLTASFTANPMGSTLSNLDQGFDETFSPGAFEIEDSEAKKGKIHSDDLNRAVLPWIEAHSQTPFFVYIHAIDTHVPFSAPQSPTNLSGQEEQDAYNAEIHFNDQQIKALYEKLTELGLADDTLLIVTSDHGESFGEHGRTGHGTNVFQEEMWIPLVWVHPNGLPSGRTDRPIQLIDLLPTILDYCHFAYDPFDFQGKNFFDETRQGEPIFLSRFLYPRDMEMKRFNSIEYYGVVEKNWKLIVSADQSAGAPGFQLFNLQTDPDEKIDLASSESEQKRHLYDLLTAFLGDQQQKRNQFINRFIVGTPDKKSENEPLSEEVREQLRSLGYIK